ncbi:unnamed protein product, partial [Amoebophrya sp. A25]
SHESSAAAEEYAAPNNRGGGAASCFSFLNSYNKRGSAGKQDDDEDRSSPTDTKKWRHLLRVPFKVTNGEESSQSDEHVTSKNSSPVGNFISLNYRGSPGGPQEQSAAASPTVLLMASSGVTAAVVESAKMEGKASLEQLAQQLEEGKNMNISEYFPKNANAGCKNEDEGADDLTVLMRMN